MPPRGWVVAAAGATRLSVRVAWKVCGCTLGAAGSAAARLGAKVCSTTGAAGAVSWLAAALRAGADSSVRTPGVGVSARVVMWELPKCGDGVAASVRTGSLCDGSTRRGSTRAGALTAGAGAAAGSGAAAGTAGRKPVAGRSNGAVCTAGATAGVLTGAAAGVLAGFMAGVRDGSRCGVVGVCMGDGCSAGGVAFRAGHDTCDDVPGATAAGVAAGCCGSSCAVAAPGGVKDDAGGCMAGVGVGGLNADGCDGSPCGLASP